MDDQLSRMMQLIQGLQTESSMQKTTGEYVTGEYKANDLLMAVRPMLPQKKQRMIDLLLKINEIQEICMEMRTNYTE